MYGKSEIKISLLGVCHWHRLESIEPHVWCDTEAILMYSCKIFEYLLSGTLHSIWISWATFLPMSAVSVAKTSVFSTAARVHKYIYIYIYIYIHIYVYHIYIYMYVLCMGAPVFMHDFSRMQHTRSALKALHTLKRALYTLKRALQIHKRALHTLRRTTLQHAKSSICQCHM